MNSNLSRDSFVAERNENGSTKLVTTCEPKRPSKPFAQGHLSVKITTLLEKPEHRRGGLKF